MLPTETVGADAAPEPAAPAVKDVVGARSSSTDEKRRPSAIRQTVTVAAYAIVGLLTISLVFSAGRVLSTHQATPLNLDLECVREATDGTRLESFDGYVEAVAEFLAEGKYLHSCYLVFQVKGVALAMSGSLAQKRVVLQMQESLRALRSNACKGDVQPTGCASPDFTSAPLNSTTPRVEQGELAEPSAIGELPKAGTLVPLEAARRSASDESRVARGLGPEPGPSSANSQRGSASEVEHRSTIEALSLAAGSALLTKQCDLKATDSLKREADRLYKVKGLSTSQNQTLAGIRSMLQNRMQKCTKRSR